MQGSFYGASNLVNTASDIPNLSGMVTLNAMFRDASLIGGPLDTGNWNWDTSTIIFTTNLFRGASLFNKDISLWNMSSVSNMAFMFYNADAFNQPVGIWDTGSVTNMSAMFGQADNFNADIGTWNTALVTNMSRLFEGGSFNQDIGNWNTSVVMNMSSMFLSNDAFNQDISTKPGAALGGLDAWNTSNVTNISSMFRFNNTFNQNLSSWDVTSLTNAANMFSTATLSTTNYDALLTAWNTQSLQSGVSFHGGNSTYCSLAAATARANMVASDSWVITDAGTCPVPAVPGIAPDLINTSDTGVNTDNITSDTTPTFDVQCTAAAVTINLYSDNPGARTLLATHICTGTGPFPKIEQVTTASTLADGVHNITYSHQNAGGESAVSLSLAVTIDTSTPPSSSGSRGGSSPTYVCKDPSASNYSRFGRHKQSKCVYKEPLPTPITESNPFGGTLCPANLTIHNNMKDGDTNGHYSSYNQGIVTEVSLLQAHINRLLVGDYGYLAAGPVDDYFRSKTKRGVERLQRKLNTLLQGSIIPLKIDGVVGPFTRTAINMSC